MVLLSAAACLFNDEQESGRSRQLICKSSDSVSSKIARMCKGPRSDAV